MLTELLQKLESEHGISSSQANGILNTIAQHVKEKFPMVGGMIDNLFGTQTADTANTSTNVNPGNTTDNESMMDQLGDLAKSKLGGLFGGKE